MNRVTQFSKLTSKNQTTGSDRSQAIMRQTIVGVSRKEGNPALS